MAKSTTYRNTIHSPSTVPELVSEPTSLPPRDRAIVLRGQLTLLLAKAVRGIPVSFESLARAERLARGLEVTL